LAEYLGDTDFTDKNSFKNFELVVESLGYNLEGLSGPIASFTEAVDASVKQINKSTSGKLISSQ
jgi:hypothetical protein